MISSAFAFASSFANAFSKLKLFSNASCIADIAAYFCRYCKSALCNAPLCSRLQLLLSHGWLWSEHGSHAPQKAFCLIRLLWQVPIVAAEAQAALAAGQAVVIGLQSTGEAAADAMQLEPNQMCGFVSTTRELLSRFVTQHFPVRYEPGPNEPAGEHTRWSRLRKLTPRSFPWHIHRSFVGWLEDVRLLVFLLLDQTSILV